MALQITDMKIASSLHKLPTERTDEDVDNLFNYLQQVIALQHIRDQELRHLCRVARYEFHPANAVLFRTGDIANCWYLLLSGSVLVGQVMFLPRHTFGERQFGTLQRISDSITVDACQLIAFDYETEKLRSQETAKDRQMFQFKRLSRHLSDTSITSSVADDMLPPRFRLTGCQDGQSVSAFATSSDTSSIGSNWSAVQQCSESGADDDRLMRAQRGSIRSVDIFCGLEETAVDSDDEDLSSVNTESQVVDIIRECLDKDPSERTSDDVEAILGSIQHLKAFSNLSLTTRRALCAAMVFAMVENADTVVMNNGEELDSWCVILNGQVEIVRNGTVEQLGLGDSFGVKPSKEKQFHDGVMHTKVDDCQFICIPQLEYNRILHEGVENTHCLSENGRLVLITEQLVGGDEYNKRQRIILRGTQEKLIEQLKDIDEVGDQFLHDFLLTYRTFIKDTTIITSRLLEWFYDPSLRDKVISIILEWINNHFEDFEWDVNLSAFLDRFLSLLEEQKLKSQLKLLHFACTSKARPRTVVLTRGKREEILHFSVLGGTERGYGLFIAKVEPGSKAAEVGLKRGDQILDVNNHNFESISHNKALEILRGSTHLSITVKCNILGLTEMVETPNTRASMMSKKQQSKHSEGRQSAQPTLSRPVIAMPASVTGKWDQADSSKRLGGGTRTAKLRRALARLNLLPSISNNDTKDTGGQSNRLTVSASGNNSPVLKLRLSASHPDLSSLQLLHVADSKSSQPEYCLRVFKADHVCKYFPVHKETTAHEVVMLALREFGILESSSNFCLCEVTVQEGLVKQRRLPDHLNNLADRCSFYSRYYIKNNMSTEQILPDNMVDDIVRESQLSFLQLNCMEVATQLTLRDFQLFRDIRPAEYVIDLFKLSPENRSQTANLENFKNLSNDEMFWVVTEVCSEQNMARRVKTIKNFIQIAKHCQEYKNFNSMFAIISGLGHGSVSRLRQTWDRVPSKWNKLFADYQDLMDPIRNFAKYRNVLGAEQVRPPIIPFFPLVIKDFFFINLGNDSELEGLVNFEKLRMIATEVRRISSMAPVSYDISVSMSGAAMLRKQSSGSSIANPRKMFEESQMVRRVRAYLVGLRVVLDEAKLAEMSSQCEMLQQPQQQGLLSTGKREVSVNLAPSNRSVNPGPIFGANSPDDARKMLELRVGMRPNDAKRNQRPTSAQIYTPSPPLTPAVMSHSPSSVRSCPAGPLLLKESSMSSFGEVNSSSVSVCQPGSKDSGVATASRSSSCSSSVGSTDSTRKKFRSKYQQPNLPVAPTRRSRPSSLQGQQALAKKNLDTFHNFKKFLGQHGSDDQACDRF